MELVFGMKVATESSYGYSVFDAGPHPPTEGRPLLEGKYLTWEIVGKYSLSFD